MDNLRVFRDAGEKGRKVRKFPTWDVSRASVDASSVTYSSSGTLVVLLYSSWLVLVVGWAVEVICLKFVAWFPGRLQDRYLMISTTQPNPHSPKHKNVHSVSRPFTTEFS